LDEAVACTAAPDRQARIADIEVLRAVAVIFVILSHAGLFYPKPGWLAMQTLAGHVRLRDGVDLFFVISGFVIGRGLLPLLGPARAAGRTGKVLRHFFIRRMFRLWPAGWLWLIVVLMASIFVDLPATLGTPHENLWGAASSILLFANVRFAADVASLQYFGGAFPYWSLSLEEQFYLVLPVLMLVAGRFLPLVLLLGIAVQWPLAHGAWLQALRSAALSWGVLLAIFERTGFYRFCEPVMLRRHPALRVAAVTALVVVLAKGRSLPGTAPRFEFGDIAAVSAALVWLASYDRGYICAWRGPGRVLVWIGGRSYSMYLAHVPAGIVTAAIAGWIARQFDLADNACIALTMATGALLVSAAAELSYRYVELPCRRAGRRIASGSSMIASD
jgi:peptidoglycan/LPS O-acetylase OafA/YrhL